MQRLYKLPDGEGSFHLCDISEAVTSQILHWGQERQRSSVINPDKLLDNLHRLHPPTVAQFKTKSPDVCKAPFRLLCKNVTSDTAAFKPHITSFTALSYCWSSAEWQRVHSLDASTGGWPVAPQIVKSIVRVLGDSEGLWTDQCCINQLDPVEKAAAISSMDVVYRSAARVLVLIQDTDLSLSEWDHFATASNPDGAYQTSSNNETLALAKIFVRLMSIRTLSRAWCLHEIQLGQNQIFLIPVGSEVKAFSIRHLHKLFTLTIDLISQHRDFPVVYEKVFLTYSNINEASIYSLPTDHLQARFGNIVELNCSITDDLISICLNVANIPLAFQGHAASRDQCKFILGLVALAAGDTTVLCGVGPSLDIDPAATRSSWMRWSRFLVMDRNFKPRSDLSSIKSLDINSLELDVLDVTKVILQPPSWHLKHISETALRCLAESLEARNVQHLLFRMQLHRDSLDRAEQLQYLARIIACTLHCGLEWMYTQYARYAQQPDYFYNPVLEPETFRICIKYLLTESGLVRSFELPKYDLGPLIELLFVICARSKVFFETLGAVKGAALLDQCHWLCIGNQYGLATISPESIGSHKIVIPTILAEGDTCVPRRLWILKQLVTQTEVFEIIYKTKLFDFNHLTATHDFTQRRIRIVGSAKAG